ncbi:uncharacterized protein THITE_157734 [Thermothielavioides terrestris NRRL 8126]|uniref:Uncharacterized protein n=1 Tax=Thermothielavioides terrestris (strain ATCC 38088 / NRRL 8126) TaxID=578455 RepID=G2QVC9_THETT|nr:uncharacterized protein THITE_157734 [Thermothielavioides terrestris NRRL 8126]AEO63816.1 hypothetical protein THITE_157734 [Thermothielavioides terrestris NRRL 8126]
MLIGASFWIASASISTTGGDVTTTTRGLEGREAAEVSAGAESAEGADEGPLNATRLVLVFIALAIDLFGSFVPLVLFRNGRSHENPAARGLGRFFEFYPAINIEHKVERTNAFISLVFGYSVVGVMFQNAGVFPLNSFLGKAILGLMQAAVFNWLYFEVDGNNIRTHAIRRTVVWQWAHFVLSMAFILAAAALSKMVLLTDCPNAPLDGLTALYQGRSGDAMSLGLRLYYCAGLGIALACMGFISLSHEYREPIGFCRFPKWVRLANRFGVSVIFMCLPAAGSGEPELPESGSNHYLPLRVDALLRALGKIGRLDAATKDNGEIDFVALGRSEKTATDTVA